MIQHIRHPILRHFRLVGSAFLSYLENMFVEHTENLMMDIFWEFYAVA